MLSNIAMNSVEAQSTCSSVNGKLAQLDTNLVKDALLEIFEDMFLESTK